MFFKSDVSKEIQFHSDTLTLYCGVCLQILVSADVVKKDKGFSNIKKSKLRNSV